MSIHYAAIARHGDYEQPEGMPSAHLPHPLTPRGREQAKLLAAQVRELAETHAAELEPCIDSSTLLRAYETASLAAGRLHGRGGERCVVAQFDALCERSVGALANLTVAQIEAVLERDPRFEVPGGGWKASREYRLPVPGAESLRTAGQRVARHLQRRMAEVAQGASGPTLKLFVGHGAAIRNAAVELGMLAEDELPRLSMHHARAVLCAYDAADGSFRHVAGEWKLRERNAAHD